MFKRNHISNEWATRIPISKEFHSNPTACKSSDGIDFRVEMSNYDLPQSIESKYSPEKKLFTISFFYISYEDTKELEIDDKISLRIGKHSNRIYQITIHLDKLVIANIISVNLSIINIFKNDKSIADRYKIPLQNYYAAKSAYTNYHDSLLGTMNHAGV